MRVNKVFSRPRTVQESHTGSLGNSQSPAGPDRPLSRASRREKNIKHKERGSSLSALGISILHFQQPQGPRGGCIRQNLVPRPKAPQGSWVASRGCCGALAVRQPLHPRLTGGLAPTPAASRSTLRMRTDGGRSGGRSKTRTAAPAAATAGAVEESAGACSPRRSSK